MPMKKAARQLSYTRSLCSGKKHERYATNKDGLGDVRSFGLGKFGRLGTEQ